MKKTYSYADVLVDLPLRNLNHPFTYRIPDNLKHKMKLGMSVLVPLGKRILHGYVVNLTEDTSREQLKDILDTIDLQPLLDEKLLQLSQWISHYYLALWWEALCCLVPPGNIPGKNKRFKPKYQKALKLAVPVEGALTEAKVLESRAPLQSRILKLLSKEGGVIAMSQIPSCNRESVERLRRKGLIYIENLEMRRDPYVHLQLISPQKIKLTSEQEEASRQLSEAIQGGKPENFLLFGITGSGKTEVYISAVRACIEKGKQAIVLVPEISLSYFISERFKEHFGDKVAILHSGLSSGERYDESRRISAGEIKVVVGTRSAVFAALSHLGLIIIDEEHEAAYKQERSPRYHAREVAFARGRLESSVVVLGSATPSLESYYKALQGEYKLLTLTRSITGKRIPQAKIIDMRRKPQSPYSPELLKAIQRRLSCGEQIVLLLNRRGFSRFIICRECGFIFKCPYCSITLTYHLADKSIKCHYCNFTKPAPSICSHCHGTDLLLRGTGIEKAEQILRSSFPAAKVLRMDRDTTSTHGSHGRILQQFAHGEADILLGTQIVAKGFHFPRVGMVGVINADVILNFPDFRASERTFQLLTQVSGRAGGEAIQGEVIFQTFTPDHLAIRTAATYDYKSFYQGEIEFRRQLRYPPFSQIVNFVFTGHKEEVVRSIAIKARDVMEEGKRYNFELLGPAPCPISRINKNYRWHITVKGENGQLVEFSHFVDREIRKRIISPSVSLTVDVDPISLL